MTTSTFDPSILISPSSPTMRPSKLRIVRLVVRGPCGIHDLVIEFSLWLVSDTRPSLISRLVRLVVRRPYGIHDRMIGLVRLEIG